MSNLHHMLMGSPSNDTKKGPHDTSFHVSASNENGDESLSFKSASRIMC